ncbi:ATP synthase subunit 9, mitochondrial-like [Aegilops tauschii subsp. strangulata]|uniref:ATP synthase subunit 9, mitochondrial-like n=1 Tax=Aegilops tauschii subsp. strangulata TaxID=200361 RepID=UPI003CC8B868
MEVQAQVLRIINKKSKKEQRRKNVTRKVFSRLEMFEGAKSIGARAATIALAGAAVGIGNVLSSLIHSVARNPSLAKQSFGYAILGFALTEAIALFAPMMAFLISFVFRSHKKECLKEALAVLICLQVVYLKGKAHYA